MIVVSLSLWRSNVFVKTDKFFSIPDQTCFFVVKWHVVTSSWNVIGLFWAEKRLIKQLAFYDVVNHMHLLHVFRFPRTYQRYAAYFDRPSAHSHHIPWNKDVFVHLAGVTAAIRTIKNTSTTTGTSSSGPRDRKRSTFCPVTALKFTTWRILDALDSTSYRQFQRRH